jgi:hypothetical protein
VTVDEEFLRLTSLHDQSLLLKEGGTPVVLLPKLSFQSCGRKLKMDVLLFPSSHSGYLTRLFFESRIDGVGQNWTEHRVVDRQWWAPSWNNVHPSLRWDAMLFAHLRAVS